MVGNVYILGQRRLKVLEKTSRKNLLVKIWGPNGYLKETILRQKEVKDMHFLCTAA